MTVSIFKTDLYWHPCQRLLTAYLSYLRYNTYTGGFAVEIGKQIKKYRIERNLSQDELAEKVYVSRQSISNWENDKNYPDMQSLLLLSTLFEITLDVLVKGDIDKMKNLIEQGDMNRFKKDSAYFGILLVLMMITPLPLFIFLSYFGLGVWICISGLGVYFAMKVEKHKKTLDMQTYKEIVAFMAGKQLNYAEKNQELGKRNYQKFLLATGCGLITLIISIIMMHYLR